MKTLILTFLAMVVTIQTQAAVCGARAGGTLHRKDSWDHILESRSKSAPAQVQQSQSRAADGSAGNKKRN
jgi:hypothetical protein